MVRAYLLLGVAALFGNGLTLQPLLRHYQEREAFAVEAMSVRSPSAATPLDIARGEDGLFHLPATVGGKAVWFIVDTGATVTVVSDRDAARLGLSRAEASTGALLTAAGTAGVTWRHLSRLEVAGTRVAALDVAVTGGGLAQSLLGQDVLSRLGTITLSGDRLTITPPRP